MVKLMEVKEKCPYCGYKHDFHKTLKGETDTRDGDISFCIKCANVGIFKGDKIVKVKLEELSIESRKEIARIKQVWINVKKRGDQY